MFRTMPQDYAHVHPAPQLRCGKICYATDKEARRAIHGMGVRRRDGGSRPVAYFCHQCQAFHWGHKIKP